MCHSNNMEELWCYKKKRGSKKGSKKGLKNNHRMTPKNNNVIYSKIL